MEELSLSSGFFIGCLGGLIAEVISWVRRREKLAEHIPGHLKSPIYWALTSIMFALGGGLVCVHIWRGESLSAILAFNIGLTSPLIIRKGLSGTDSAEIGEIN